MYPRINEMLKALHDRKISTFLVTNAQVRHLEPHITRDILFHLYVETSLNGFKIYVFYYIPRVLLPFFYSYFQYLIALI